MWRNHDGERPDDRPTPVVRLDPEDPILPRKPTNLPEPVLDDSIIRDHETEVITLLGPLAAYRYVGWLMGGEFAARWSTFVKRRGKEDRALAALLWEVNHGKGIG